MNGFVGCDSMTAMLTVNAEAPDFTLDGVFQSEIGRFRLADWRGRWVILFFYPANFTFVYPAEIRELENRMSQLRSRQTGVFAISVDDVASHRAWIRELGGLSFPLLSDSMREASRAYGVLNEADGRASHAVFMISPQGRVAYMVVSPMNVDFSLDETIRILEKVQEDSDSVELPRDGPMRIAKPESDSTIPSASPDMIAPVDRLLERKQEIERRIRAREFVFGIQDGLLSTVGLLSGIAAATHNQLTVLIAGVTAAITGGLSMATGSYLATRTEQGIFEKELADQERIARRQPYLAQEALLESLVTEGLDRPSAYRIVQKMSRHRGLLLRTVQEKVLGLGSVDISQPFKAAVVMYFSFMLGAAIPLLPFFIATGNVALFISWAASIATLLAVGVFKGILTGQPLFRSGLEFAAVALGSALVGWLIGTAFEHFLI